MKAQMYIGMQGGQVITEGVGRGSEVEDDVDPVAAREYLTNPTKLLSVDLPFIQELRRWALVKHTTADPFLAGLVGIPSITVQICSEQDLNANFGLVLRVPSITMPPQKV